MPRPSARWKTADVDECGTRLATDRLTSRLTPRGAEEAHSSGRSLTSNAQASEYPPSFRVDEGTVRVTFRRIFLISGRPFGDVRVDFERSRRDGWIRVGQVIGKGLLQEVRGPFGSRFGSSGFLGGDLPECHPESPKQSNMFFMQTSYRARVIRAPWKQAQKWISVPHICSGPPRSRRPTSETETIQYHGL